MKNIALEETGRLQEFFSSSSYPNQPVILDSMSQVKDLLQDIDTVLFDCDGVLYESQEPCPGASESIQSLMGTLKKIVLFVTNNAGVNRRQLRDKLTHILNLNDGCHLTSDQMVSSSYASSLYLQAQLPNGARVYVIGSAGLCEELVEAGFTVIGGPDPNGGGSMDRQELAEYDFSSYLPVDAVVVGHDTAFTFRKLCVANNLLLQSPKALFVATNLDSFDLVRSNIAPEHPNHIPGNGCIVKALEYCSQRQALNVGKPSTVLAEILQSEHNLGNMRRCLFVGDRLDTDILFAKNNGMRSLLVMTGVTTAEQLKTLSTTTSTPEGSPKAEEQPLPDFILPYVGRLTQEF